MHDHLLGVAVSLLKQPRPPAEREQAYLRRAVSSAYYALFHLLAFEGASLLSAQHARSLARGFDHGPMRVVCAKFSPGQAEPQAPTDVSIPKIGIDKVPVPLDLALVAWEFVALHAARHLADYNFVEPVTKSYAAERVKGAQRAFRCWRRIRSDPAARLFLGLLLAWPGVERRKD